MSTTHKIDPRDSMERCYDLVFEHRIKYLTAKKRWGELQVVQLEYAAILTDREADHSG